MESSSLRTASTANKSRVFRLSPDLFDPCVRRRHRLRPDRHPCERACDRLEPSGRLFYLALGPRPALPDLSLVFGSESGGQRLMVELSITVVEASQFRLTVPLVVPLLQRTEQTLCVGCGDSQISTLR